MLAALITWVMTLSAPNRPSNSHSARCAMAQPCISSVLTLERSDSKVSQALRRLAVEDVTWRRLARR